MKYISLKNTFFVVLMFLMIVAVVWLYYDRVAGPSEIHNVLLISIDTCRADYLSCYGYPLETTPNIDAIADESMLFENAISPIPLTLPAHCSMLTGTIPPHHGIHDNLNYSLDQSNVTLAEILSERGYTTAAFISAFVLESQFGLDQGFDVYDDHFENSINVAGVGVTRLGQETTNNALEWFDSNMDKDFFMFLHYYDSHSPYEPPAPFASKFHNAPYSSEIASKYKKGFYAGEIIRYAGEIAYVDHCIGQVIAKLKKLGQYDSTLIIVVGDHGEMLGEHGEGDHGYFIYQSAIKVPLIIKLPGKSRPKRIHDAVGLVDIVPTICGLLGIDTPVLEGEDLSPYCSAEPVSHEQRYYYCESLTPTKYGANSLLGMVGDRFKYIQTTRPELYDLSVDPWERCNIAPEYQQRGRILQDQLQQVLEHSISRERSEGNVELDAESIKRLESLGYIAGNVSEDFEFDRNKDDPKDVVDFHISLTHVNYLMGQKQYAEVKKVCEDLIRSRPQCSLAYFQMALAAKEQNDFSEAAIHLQKAIDLEPDKAIYHTHLAKISYEQAEFDRACEHLKKSLQLNPHQVDAHVELAIVFSKLNQHEQAISHLTEALRLRPEETPILNKMGKAHDKLQNTEEAVRYLSQSLHINPDQPEIQNKLATIYHQQGETAKAIDHWYAALQCKPDWISVLNNLAWIKACNENEKYRNPEEAVKLAQLAGKLTKFKIPEVLDSLAAALASAGRFSEAVETASKAVKLARSSNREYLAEEIQSRLELYKNMRPYFDIEHNTK